MLQSFRYRVLLSALLLLLGVAGVAWAGAAPSGDSSKDRPLQAGINIQVNEEQQLPPDDYPNRNSPSVAASENGKRVLVVFEDFQGFCGPPTNKVCPVPDPNGLTGYAYSTDAGAHWVDAGALPPIGEATNAGHPWVARGGEGSHEVYYAVSRMRIGLAGLAGLGIYRGHFDGTSFVWDKTQIINSSNPNDQYSRAAIASSEDGRDAYVILSNVIELCGIASFGFGQIEVWRTHDGGETWQGPAVVSPDPAENTDPNDPLCGVLGPLQVAPAISVGPKGHVYAVWQKGPRLLDLTGGTESTSSIGFAVSNNGGTSFTAPRTLVGINANYQNTPVGHGKSRQNDQPRIAVAAGGPFTGRVYVTYYQPVAPVQSPITVQSLTSAEAYIVWSDNRGRTWSAPKLLAPAVPATGVKRFWPSVSIRKQGEVDVVYMESREAQATAAPDDIECDMPTGQGRRQGKVSSLVDTYFVESQNGGSTFSAPLRISEETTNWCTTFYSFTSGVFSNYGDYIGIAATKKKTFVLWPDGRNGVTDVFFSKVSSGEGHDD